ncbi:MAG: phosphoribosylglycinamide formyltransferase [Phycisphaerae bacterium]|nr:phosphoribosylglycinamide formyltransferase [Phycisphaerae bacterium]
MTEASPLRLGCLISGGGRTVLNLKTAIERDAIPAEIATVIAHREDLAGVHRCRAAGLGVEIVTDRGPDPLDEILLSARVDLVCLCGYLRHFAVEPRWKDRVVNIHPSLLPSHGGRGMYGDRVHAAVLAAGEAETGCTVHVVDEIYDHGAVILQRRCPVRPDDTTSTLAARVFEAECVAMPTAIRGLAEGRIRIEQGRVTRTVTTPAPDSP